MHHDISRILPPGALPAGTPNRHLKAGEWIRAVAPRTGQPIGPPKDIAWRLGINGAAELTYLAIGSRHRGYGGALQRRQPPVMAAGYAQCR